MAKSRFSTVNFGSANTGLVGTIGYTIYLTSGTVSQARTTSGIVEFGSTGVYGAQVNLDIDKPMMVLWDTGGGSPIYGSEQNNIQLDDIQNETDNIRAIWNSIKNQGAIFTALMDKMGMIEKNKGLTKPDVEDAITKGIKSIEFPKPQEIIIPPYPEVKDYSSKIDDIFQSIKSLSLTSVKLNTLKIENMMAQLSSKIDSLPKYDSNFSSMQGFIQEAVSRLENSIKSDNSSVSNEVKSSRQQMMNELLKLQHVFSRFDSLMTKITAFNEKLNQLDSNDKSLNKAKDFIQAEIQRLNILVNTIALIDRTPRMNETETSLIRSFGGKRG